MGILSDEETAEDEHLRRSRSVWDRRSDSYERDERELAPMRRTAIDYLDLDPGDRVLEIGCGPGVNFEQIASEIGDEGELIAVDYSPQMVEAARDRIEEHGWETVEVRRAEATSADLGPGFDAVVATLSMSVMPDARRAVENAYDALAEDGSLVVFDVRTVPRGPARIVNPLLGRLLAWYANWNPDGDVVEAVQSVFDESEVVETYALGVSYTLLARKRA
ncbi:class I SAM-dependent methyltransferase [Natrialbaceae archaeon A-arb3/5]